MVKLKGKLSYITLFLVALVLYIAIMAFEGAYPFGTNSILYEDAMDQYTGILVLVIEWIKSGCHGTFLWENGLGVDILLNMYYYGMSPFNIIAFVMGTENIELSMTIMMVLKTALLPSTAFFFFKHTNLNRFASEELSPRTRTFAQMVMALAFGLSGYIIAFNHNVIWLDSLLLLPFIAIAVERLAQGKNHVSYVALLALCIILNFYYAFYICLFIFCYFFVQEQESVKSFFKSILRFALMSLLAAGISAVVLLPAAYFVFVSSNSGFAVSTVDWFQVGNIGSFINSFYALDSFSTGYLFNHNNFCGTFVGILIMVFLLQKNVSLNLRIRYVIVSIFIAAGLNVAGLNYVLHGFVVPHGLGNRFGFIMTFLVLAMSYVAIISVASLSGKRLIPVILIPIAIFGAEMLLNTDKASSYSYLISMFMIVACAMLLIFFFRDSIKQVTFYRWILILWAAELLFNGFAVLSTKYAACTLEDYLNTDAWLADYQALETEAGERTSALYTWNYLPYTQAAWYSSVINGSTIDAFASLGLAHNTNVEYTYRRTTELAASLFNVRYVVTTERGDMPGYSLVNENDGVYTFEADRLLGMGFVASDDLANWTADSTPAENQNEFVRLATGGQVNDNLFDEIIFDDLEIELIGAEFISYENDVCTFECNNDFMCRMALSFTVDEDMELYMESFDSELETTVILVNGESISSTDYVESDAIIYVGSLSAGDQVEVRMFSTAYADKEYTKEFRFYTYNSDVFDAFYQCASANTLEFGSYSGNKMTAAITADEDGLLFLSLPYNYGFTIYVDGVKTDVVKIGSGLMGVNVTAGTHDIVVKYNTPLLLPGVIISLIGIIILIAFIVIRKKGTEVAQEEN